MSEMENFDDAELIRIYLRGDEKAFNILYERYRTGLYGYLNMLLSGRTAEADDIFQQTWLKAITRLENYREEGNFRAWLFRIARNLTLDRFRSVYFRPGVMLDIDSENFRELEDGEEIRPCAGMDEEFFSEKLTAAVEELSWEQKEVFLLRSQNLSFKEIAKLQNCPVNTALGRMQYAIRKLRSKLKGVAE